ncbi:hypothetical protein JMN32_05410 [Fulvivirga sp. 29W222]|uniref:Uncharacterized protein n=1 Tax=Fulvivirga marina TaxID=2494733 RepID=A0A937FZG9_9BACT|nr:hypothetical protein [Fulvivirga marina]MBL6445736.1 hypothetical protein [Fulvivirga marina]
MPENLKSTSLTRCWVLKNNNQTRVFYSRDKKSKRSKPDQAVGIRRFRKMLLVGALKGDWKKAIIYENRQGGREVDRVDPTEIYK